DDSKGSSWLMQLVDVYISELPNRSTVSKKTKKGKNFLFKWCGCRLEFLHIDFWNIYGDQESLEEWSYQSPLHVKGSFDSEEKQVAIGATPPKPKASVQKTRSSSDITVTPPTAATGPRLTTSEKGKQEAKASKAKSLSALSEVAMIEAQQLKLSTKRSLQQTHISQASGSGADEGTGSIPGVPDVPIDESE
nr:hypothetical protein [Tanacetum cinerariifolium]